MKSSHSEMDMTCFEGNNNVIFNHETSRVMWEIFTSPLNTVTITASPLRLLKTLPQNLWSLFILTSVCVFPYTDVFGYHYLPFLNHLLSSLRLQRLIVSCSSASFYQDLLVPLFFFCPYSISTFPSVQQCLSSAYFYDFTSFIHL